MSNLIDLEKKLRQVARKVASDIAKDAREKLCNKYASLIEMYYSDYTPGCDKYGVPYYIRTGNLKKSYSPYMHELPRDRFVGGVYINASKMQDYDSVKGSHDFPAERLLEKFIFTTTLPSATWHGGDWHGGYGVMNSFSIYEEMIKYRDDLVKEYSKKRVRYEDYVD